MDFKVTIESKEKQPFKVNVYFWGVQDVDHEGVYHGIKYKQQN